MKKGFSLSILPIQILFLILAILFSNTCMSDGDESISISAAPIDPACNRNKGPFPPPPPIPPLTKNNSSLITIWFDDGWRTQLTEAYPLMEKYQYKAAIAVAINFVCHPSFVTWNELRFLQLKGWETTSHTVSHSCNFSFYTTKNTLHELIDSKKILIAEGLRADHFVMPCGFSREQIDDHFIGQHPPIIETAEKYYNSYRTTALDQTNALPIQEPNNLSAFQLRNTTTDKEIQDVIDEALKNKTWLIFVFHQIDESQSSFAISPARFKSILERIKLSGLPVVLPSQVIRGKK